MKIASLSPAATEILFALGLQEDIVCVDQFSRFPDAAKDLPHVKDHQKVDPDELRTFGPEIVLTGTVVQEKLAEHLRSAGFGVVHQDPRMLNDIYESIRQLGVLFGAQEQASTLILQMQQGFNDVKKKAGLLPSHPKIYVEEWHQPPFVSGNWVPEIVKIAGGVSFPIQIGQLSREVTLDEVRKFDPDLIVISWCGAGSLADKDLLMKRPGWDSLRAVQEARIRVVDDSLLNRPGPRLVEGTQRIYGWLFEMLHGSSI